MEASSIEPGRIVDGYRIIRPIGRGGFGTVWLCRSEAIGDLRAMKFVPSDNPESLQKELDALTRFRAAGSKLHTRSLMPIEHINHLSDGLVYVMPLADGYGAEGPMDPAWKPWTLEDLIVRQRRQSDWFSSTEVVELMEPVLAGLQALSDAGLVHRDVKPDNILFVEAKPCLADISLLAEDADKLTRRGTPGFTAPSWFVDSGGQPDMYGAAATLYTLLTGNAPDKMGRAAYRWPPQGEASLSKPERDEWIRLNAAILRATHEDAAERYTDFGGFARSLARHGARADAFPQAGDTGFTPDRERPQIGQKGRKSAIIGFLLGILGMLAWLLPLIGFPITIAGLMLSLGGMKSQMKSLSLVGILLNAVFLGFTILNFIIGAIAGMHGHMEYPGFIQAVKDFF